MSENMRSMILGTLGLQILAVIALILALSRSLKQEYEGRLDKLMQVFLLGIACQCLHFIEEFVTGFYVLFPKFWRLAPWTAEFFIVINLGWMALWLVSAVGIRKNYRVAFFPVWFFALGMLVNLIGHPLLALANRGYFPGLFTSLLVGAMGFLLVKQLFQVTSVKR